MYASVKGMMGLRIGSAEVSSRLANYDSLILQIVGTEACFLCNTSKHAGTDFYTLVKGKYIVRPS